MLSETEALRVPIDAFTMQLRPSEVQAVAAGLPGAPALEAVAAAVRELSASDRAPFWELAMRHYARGKPLAQATGEIGMDAVHGEALLQAFTRALSSPTSA